MARRLRSRDVWDEAVQEYEEGFLLAEVPLGEGFLDLAKISRKCCPGAQPKVQFNLEMMTRDPLKIPCLTKKYRATLGDIPGQRLPDLAISVLQNWLAPAAGGTIFVRSIVAARCLVKCHWPWPWPCAGVRSPSGGRQSPGPPMQRRHAQGRRWRRLLCIVNAPRTDAQVIGSVEGAGQVQR